MGSCQSHPNIVLNDGIIIRSRHALIVGNRLHIPLGDQHETKKWISIDMDDRAKLKMVNSKRKTVNFTDDTNSNSSATP